MNRKLILRILEIVLAIVLVVSLAMNIRTRIEYAQSASAYAEAATMAELPKLAAIPARLGEKNEAAPDPNLALMAEINLDELRQRNSDVLGWISIPETILSYPLLQGTDNDFYLTHSWKKNSSINGAVFLDFRSNAELTDFNTIVYGHRMLDGSMFDSLRSYEDQEHWRTHPSVYLACAEGVYRYDIFAAYEAKADITGPIYGLTYLDDSDREAFIDSCLAQSLIDSGIVPTAGDQILTLSTCADRGYATRWVVQAVLTEFYDRTENASN